MATDDQGRLEAFLRDPQVPEDAKRQAVAAYKAQQGDTTTTPTTTYANRFRPLAQAAGGALGGTVGGLAAGPLGAVGGAGLGTAGGGQTFDALLKFGTALRGGTMAPLTGGATLENLGKTAKQVGGDFTEGAVSEMGGQIVSKGLTSAIGRMYAKRQAKIAANQVRRAALERQGITPLASDITQSRMVGQVENAPTAFIGGSGPLERARQTQVAEVGKRAQAVLDPSGTALPPVATGGAMQGGVKTAVGQWKAKTGALFDAIEQEAGDADLVPTAPILEAIDAIVARKTKTAMGVSGVTRNVQSGLTLTPDADALIEVVKQREAVPFWMARELESQLGDLSKTQGAYVGNVRKSEFGQLYAGVRQSIDAFMDSDAGSNLAPRLAAAKQDWRIGKQLFDESLAPVMQAMPEDTFKAVFNPSSITELLDFRQGVSDDVWQQAVAGWKGAMLTEATDPNTGLVRPQKLARILGAYEKSGALDIILGPQAGEVRDMAQAFATLGGAERTAGGGNPSGTGQQIINSASLAALPTIASGVATGNPAAMTTGLGTFVLPALQARATTSPTGVDLLSRTGPTADQLRALFTSGNVPDLQTLASPEMIRAIAQTLGAQP